MIPHIIHQTWKNSTIPPQFLKFQEGWKKCHPTWEYKLWTDKDNILFLEENYSWFVDTYLNYGENIMRADAIRYFILNHYGGLYVDLDFECLKKFDPLTKKYSLILGCEPESHTEKKRPQERGFTTIICNALMASVPKHLFWEEVFQQLINFRYHETLDATGPFLLTQAYQKFPHKKSVHLEKASTFFPLSAEEMFSKKLTSTEYQQKTQDSYAIHYWVGTWWRKPRLSATIVKQIGKKLVRKFAFLLLKITQVFHFKKIASRIKMLVFTSRYPLTSQVLPYQLYNKRTYFSLLEKNNELCKAEIDITELQCYQHSFPKVSCLMITKNRDQLARRAIQCFLNQTYTNKELIIIDEGERLLEKWLIENPTPQITYFRQKTPASLGELRNKAVQHATGEYVTQWDDDDLSHPESLSIKIAFLQVFNAEICILQRQYIWNQEAAAIGLSHRYFWEATFMAKKNVMPLYPQQRRGEDVPVITELVANNRCVLLDYPTLYVYSIHGNNTFQTTHFVKMWNHCSEFYTDDAFHIAIKNIEDVFHINLQQSTKIPFTSQYESRGKTTIPKQKTETSLTNHQEHSTTHATHIEPYPHLLILTPVKNALPFLRLYFHNLQKISYPKEKISIAFLDSDSNDGTYEGLQKLKEHYGNIFSQISIYQHDFSYETKKPRWHITEQYKRRSILAKSRNYLLFQALRSYHQQVLWLDVDICQYPYDIIQTLLSFNKHIIVPNCVCENGQNFDLNTYKTREDAHHLNWKKYIYDGILQPPVGYGRLYLNDLTHKEIIDVDAVGGTMLLINSDLHRQGLIFPSYSYRQLIETEGLALMAKDMGYKCWATPNIKIIHARN